MSKAQNGDNVNVHYKGTFDDGTIFDSSYDRGTTISFTVGGGQMITGFDTAVNGMAVGEVKKVRLTPAQPYGDSNPQAFAEVPKDSFPAEFPLNEGVTVQGTDGQGAPVIGTIEKIAEDNVLINMNHPMAGKDLNFEIELVEIVDTTDTDDSVN